jgi:DNA-binding response OmpR family regulator
MITSLHLQAIKGQENYVYNQQQQQQQHHNQKNRRHILLVDDEPDICMAYQIVLQDAGYECNVYTDPVKALQEFRAGYYDLILLDIKMPVLDGYELCRKIREQDKAVRICFITVSEMIYENFRSQHYPELSDIFYIQKPISNEELIERVSKIIMIILLPS